MSLGDERVLLTQRLQALRRDRGLSQRTLADAIGVDRSTYAYYELGRTRPTLETLVCIARYYEVSLDYLIGLD